MASKGKPRERKLNDYFAGVKQGVFSAEKLESKTK